MVEIDDVTYLRERVETQALADVTVEDAEAERSERIALLFEAVIVNVVEG